MKRLLLVVLVLLTAFEGFSNNFYFAFNGYGHATRYNFDLGLTYGAYYYHGIGKGIGLGTQEFYQNVNLLYDKERTSVQGSSMRTNCKYYFFSPMVVFQLSNSGQTQAYVTGGIGQLKEGTAEFHRWSRVPWQQNTNYDETHDYTDSIEKYIGRLGLGLTQFYHLTGNFHLFLNEDIGFIITPMANLGNPAFSAVKGNMAQFLQPTYFSLRIGVAFIPKSKDLKYPYRIYSRKGDYQEW
jgi:hypothetical protein